MGGAGAVQLRGGGRQARGQGGEEALGEGRPGRGEARGGGDGAAGAGLPLSPWPATSLCPRVAFLLHVCLSNSFSDMEDSF